MQGLDTLKAQLNHSKPTLQKTYHITQLGIFGSYVRGEQTENSDVDVLVEFEPDFRFGLFTFCQLESDLSR